MLRPLLQKILCEVVWVRTWMHLFCSDLPIGKPESDSSRLFSHVSVKKILSHANFIIQLTIKFWMNEWGLLSTWQHTSLYLQRKHCVGGLSWRALHSSVIVSFHVLSMVRKQNVTEMIQAHKLIWEQFGIKVILFFQSGFSTKFFFKLTFKSAS